MPNLTRLSLARNKLTKLVPRLFYKLDKLEQLDLSGNPLTEIHPDDIKDAKALRKLHLAGNPISNLINLGRVTDSSSIASFAGCQLKRFHSLVYQSLQHLEELDLRENSFVQLASNEFKHLHKLSTLLLDGNKLTTLRDNTFFGLTLDVVGLSRNKIVSFSDCAFCNASIKRIDLSRNKIESIQERLFDPLKDSLGTLNIEENNDFNDSPRSIRNVIQPLKKLKVLSLASTELGDSIPDYMFESQADSLISLDLSSNKFVNVSAKWLQPLHALKELDLSRNQIYGISKSVLNTFDAMTSLEHVYLQDNPWSCYRCHIIELLDWINTHPTAYTKACQSGDGFCVKCESPSELRGRDVHTLDERHIEWCVDPTVQLRLAASEPRIGLVLAMLIIISLIIVIITVVIMYKKQGATYYTHEDERLEEKAVFTIQQQQARGKGMSLCPSSPPLSPAPISTAGSATPPQMSPSSESSSVPVAPPPPPPPPQAPGSRKSSMAAAETKPKVPL